MKSKPELIQLKTGNKTTHLVCFGEDKEAATNCQLLIERLIDDGVFCVKGMSSSRLDEEAAILEILYPLNENGETKFKTMAQIKSSLTRKKNSPFKAYSVHGEASKQIELRVNEMVTCGEIYSNGDAFAKVNK